MSDRMYEPSYIEFHDEIVKAQLSILVKVEVTKHQSMTELVKLENGKWLAKFEYDPRKTLDRLAAERSANNTRDVQT